MRIKKTVTYTMEYLTMRTSKLQQHRDIYRYLDIYRER